MFDDKTPTKTAKTKKVYIDRAKKRLISYTKNTGDIVANTPKSAAKLSHYLQEQRTKNNYKQTTWRRIRAELKYYFEHTEQKTLVDMVIDLPRTKIEQPENKLAPQQRTAYKHLPDKPTQELISALEMSQNTEYANLAISLIYGTWLTGIRPKEWGTLKYHKNYDGSAYHLAVVENAKNTNGRAFDKRRTIAIEKASEKQLESMDYIYEVAKGLRLKYTNIGDREIVWKNVYTKVRKLIYSTFLKVRPRAKKTITLYSARHQFASDCKKKGLSEYDIAVLMGHASIDTATRYYGRKRFGDAENHGVAPLAQQVAMIQTKRNAKIKQARSQTPDWDKLVNDPTLKPQKDSKKEDV
jgi:integrase